MTVLHLRGDSALHGAAVPTHGSPSGAPQAQFLMDNSHKRTLFIAGSVPRDCAVKKRITLLSYIDHLAARLRIPKGRQMFIREDAS